MREGMCEHILLLDLLVCLLACSLTLSPSLHLVIVFHLS